jgi:hypothetical protein
MNRLEDAEIAGKRVVDAAELPVLRLAVKAAERPADVALEVGPVGRPPAGVEPYALPSGSV